jgi:hypothetical protein
MPIKQRRYVPIQEMEASENSQRWKTPVTLNSIETLNEILYKTNLFTMIV